MSGKILGVWLAWLVFILLPGPAAATFHLVKVVEVFAGTTADPTAQYVVLQMYFPGQTLVTGHSMTVFDANGTKVGTFTFSHNLSNGNTLATMLIATPDAATLFGVTADLTMMPVIPLGGGAVCWDVVNCVAWGNFSGSGHLPISPGAPFNAPNGLLLDMAMHRDVSSGGTVTDFVFAPPAPKNNAGQSGTFSPTPTVPPTVTPTPPPGSCVGDCNGDGQVTVNELIQMVNVALGSAAVSTCTAGDANGDGEITVNEIVAGVNNALNGCAASQGIAFSVGPDEAPTYPSTLTNIPDEHTTFVPPAAGSDTYLVFAATFGGLTGAPVVLETKDLQNFTLAAGYTQPVMSPPLHFTTCKSSYDPEFDLNYAAPGSVVHDPTQPLGNLIMIFEAENHCPGGVWQQPFYVTVGATRSSDNGKTWPPSVDSELGGPDRYPVLKISTPEPMTAEQPPVPLGDALPSAFVDGNNLYVAYSNVVPGNDGLQRVARATLGGSGPLSFLKWRNGAFSEPGIGGLDSGVLPAHGCPGYQLDAQISYDDALSLYLMTFVCVSVQKDSTGIFQPYQAAWYFSTATSLDSQNWTAPQLIENSQFPVAPGCGAQGTGRMFDGWYPSFVSPGSTAGHLSTSGRVFFMDGCDIGKRTFMSRTFAITAAAP